jgi:hypothetical protein
VRDYVDSVKKIHFVRDNVDSVNETLLRKYEDSVIYSVRVCIDSVKDTLCA